MKKSAINLRNVDGTWHVVIKGAAGREHLFSTGCTDRRAANLVADAAGVAEVVKSHETAAVSLLDEMNAVLRSTQNGNVSHVVEEWKIYAKLKCAPATFVGYSYHVDVFVRRLKIANASLQSVPLDAMLGFINEAGKGKVTRTMRLASVQHLFDYASARGFLKNNHAQLLFVNHRTMTIAELETVPRQPITAEDYAKIMAVAKGFWRHATALAYWTGLRLGDCCNFERESLTREPGQIIVWTKKRNRRVSLSIDDPLIGSGELRAIIAEILEQRTDETWCFPYQHDLYAQPWNGEISNTYGVLLRKAGVEKGKSFHSLRHAAITRWKLAGKSLEDIGSLVGHASIKTTEGYVHV